MNDRRKQWEEQCDAAKDLHDHFGYDTALSYLVGQKLLRFVQIAKRELSFADELPAFLTRIRENFELGELEAYLDSTRNKDGRDRRFMGRLRKLLLEKEMS